MTRASLRSLGNMLMFGLHVLLMLLQALTTIGDAAQAQANSAPATTGRRLAQLPPANDPSKPAQPFGYR